MATKEDIRALEKDLHREIQRSEKDLHKELNRLEKSMDAKFNIIEKVGGSFCISMMILLIKIAFWP